MKKRFLTCIMILVVLLLLSSCYSSYDHCELIESPVDVQKVISEMSNSDSNLVEVCDVAENEQWQLYACTAEGKFGYYLEAIKDERGDFREYGSGYDGWSKINIMALGEDNDFAIGIISDGTAKEVIFHNDKTGEEVIHKLEKEGISAYIFESDWQEISFTSYDENGNIIEK